MYLEEGGRKFPRNVTKFLSRHVFTFKETIFFKKTEDVSMNDLYNTDAVCLLGDRQSIFTYYIAEVRVTNGSKIRKKRYYICF